MLGESHFGKTIQRHTSPDKSRCTHCAFVSDFTNPANTLRDYSANIKMSSKDLKCQCTIVIPTT